MHRHGHAFGLLLIALGGSACATNVSGEMETLVLTSEPPGATVEVEPGWFEVKTPTQLEVKRVDGPFRLTFTMEGYEPQQAHVGAVTNWWILGNFVFGWTIGNVIDYNSGADTALVPTEIHARLAKRE